VDVTTGATIELGTGMMDQTFTPDGRSVIYRTSRADGGGIYAVDVDGTNRRKLTDSPEGTVSFTVSPLLKRERR
jgi:Tol biopolymer transport system component